MSLISFASVFIPHFDKAAETRTASREQAHIDVPAGTQIMSAKDYLVDEDRLTGKSVIISGSALCAAGNLCYLYADSSNPMLSVNFDPKNLSRDDRRQLLDCQPYTNPCDIAVLGRGNSGMLPEFTASAIIWSPDDLATVERALAQPPPRPSGSIRGTDNTSLNAVQRGAIGDQVRECWSRDAGALHADTFEVHLIVTTDAQGVARIATIAPGDPAAALRSPQHALAERAVRAVLSPQCSALPLPDTMKGQIHRFDFIFKP